MAEVSSPVMFTTTDNDSRSKLNTRRVFAQWEKSHTEIWNLKESAKANKFPYLFKILTHPKWDRSAPITITWHIPVTCIFKPIVKTLFLDELWNPLENIFVKFLSNASDQFIQLSSVTKENSNCVFIFLKRNLWSCQLWKQSYIF